jgi:hypothetical protein
LNGGRPGRKGVILGNSDGEWIGGLKSGRRSSRTIQTTLWGLDYGLHSFWMALDDAAMHLRYRTCPPLIGSPQTPLRSTDTELPLLIPTQCDKRANSMLLCIIRHPPVSWFHGPGRSGVHHSRSGGTGWSDLPSPMGTLMVWPASSEHQRACTWAEEEYGVLCKCNHFKVTLWRDTVLVHFILLIN